MKIIGHRGARGLAPENTVAGFKKALEYNIDGVEFDLRLTKDRVIVIHHDDALKNEAGRSLVVAESSYEQLKDFKPDLATFDDAINALKGRTLMHIEIKEDVPIEEIVNQIKKFKLLPKDFEICSFDFAVLKAIAQAMPEARLAVLERWSGLRASRRAKKLNTKTIAMRQNYLWGGFIKLMAMRGYKLWAYTVNDPNRAKKLTRYGLVGITTDYPNRFVNKV